MLLDLLRLLLVVDGADTADHSSGDLVFGIALHRCVSSDGGRTVDRLRVLLMLFGRIEDAV